MLHRVIRGGFRLSPPRAPMALWWPRITLASAHNFAQFSSAPASLSSLYENAVRIIEDAGDDSSQLSIAKQLLNAAAANTSELTYEEICGKLRGGTAYAPAVGRLGRWYVFGVNETPRDVPKGLSMMHAAALNGDVESCYWYGRVWDMMDSIAAKVSTGGCSSTTNATPEVPDPTLTETPESAEFRISRGKEVLSEIKNLRRMALKERNERIRSMSSSSRQGSSSADVFESENPLKLPLTRNFRRAYYWLSKAAAQDHQEAQVALGNLLIREATENELMVLEGVSWYEAAAGEQVVPPSDDPRPLMAPPGLSHTSRDSTAPGVPVSDVLGNVHGLAPHTDALYNLGMLFWEGVVSPSGKVLLPKDKKRGFQYFERGAAFYDSASLFFVGHVLHVGDKDIGVRGHAFRALRHLEMASGLGHAEASYYLAQFWREGAPGFPPSQEKVQYFLELAAKAGEPQALYDLGCCLLHGLDGYVVNESVALQHFEAAGSRGVVAASVSAGAMYYSGKGVPVQYEKAMEWYQRAADEGSIDAWVNVAEMYATGKGVTASEKTAEMILNMVKNLRQKAKETADQQAQSTPLVEEVSANTCCGGSCGRAEACS